MLRPYQVQAIQDVRTALVKHGSAILQMPTGSGKTKTAAEIVRTTEGIVWFVCHRQEIERQVAKALTEVGIEHGVVSPRGTPAYERRVQVISVKTLAARIHKLPSPTLVIWDECHHVAAASWSKIRNALTSATHLGLTATPERLDGKGLGEWFNDLIIGPSISELIKDGWLSPFRYFAPSEPDLSAAKLQAGDYSKKDIGKIMNTPVLIGDAVREYRANIDGKRALVFAASIEASKALVERFNAEGVPACHVDGQTKAEDREVAVAALASGSIKVLSNVEVFTEGFDLPAIDAVILMRPTKSLALYLQMIGRALRTAEDKSEALVFDHAGLHRDHPWVSDSWEWSLEGGARQRRIAKGCETRKCPECKEVRAERVLVCACGYEFPSGREIGEFDGVLREVVPIIPEGFTTRTSFADLMRISWTTVKSLEDEGMPSINGLIEVVSAVQWLKSRASPYIPPVWKDNAAEYEPAYKFAKRIKSSDTTIKRMCTRGLPHAENGWVEVFPALQWLQENPQPLIPPFWEEEVEKFEHPHRFAERCGVSWDRVTSLRRSGWLVSGIPCSSNKWIHYERGLEWVKNNRPGVLDDAHEGRVEFAARLNVKHSLVVYWSEYYKMPTKFGGVVHIKQGLEWVRDNTSIQIPPEAWPSDNDNTSQSEREDAA